MEHYKNLNGNSDIYGYEIGENSISVQFNDGSIYLYTSQSAGHLNISKIWYQVFMVVGFIVFLLSGMGMLKAYPTLPTAQISLGIFFFGIGEWINHPLQTRIAAFGVITGHPRNTSISGVLFDLLGIALIGFGTYQLLV